MTTTKALIREWLDGGLARGATHMIIVCDGFSHDDYPVCVMPGEKVAKVVNEYRLKSMQRIVGVCDLTMDIESQLKEQRTLNY